MSGTDVREALPRIKKGIKEAIEFLKKNVLVEKLSNLPYPTMLIPLVAFFEGPEDEQYSLSDKQVKLIKQWFWRVSYARRYSSGTKRNLEADIAAARILRKEGESTIGTFDSPVSSSNFTDRKFIGGTVDTKTFVLLLANQKPKSLVNGASVQVSRVLTAGNRAEFHHLFPQAYLKAKGLDPAAINSLVNFCILSAADNKKVGSKAPSEYRNKLVEDIADVLNSNLIPDSVFSDDFEMFQIDRAEMLVQAANLAMGR